MKRLYYLTNDLAAVERVSQTLHDEGVTDWNFHVLCKDKATIHKRHLNGATPIQELDIVRQGERGAMLGILVGIVVVCVIAFFFSSGGINFALQIGSIFVLACFGAWVGGLIGISSENYKIRRFHNDIEQGRFLLMIDTDLHQKARIEKIMVHFPTVLKVGEDSTTINPFETVTSNS